MSKKVLVPFVFLVFVSLVVFVSAETIDFSGVDSIIEEYNSGSIDIAQFVVNVNIYLEAQYQDLEKEGHFEGFDKNDIESMFKDEKPLMKNTKDFGIMFEPYKTKEGYTILWGLPPSQKAVDNAIREAEESYAEAIINEIQIKEDIPKEEINIDFSEFDIEKVICQARYKEEIKIRKLFEEAMPEFPKWYFGEFNKGVDEYFSMSSGHQYLMHIIDSNKRAIIEGENCVDNKEEYGVIEINHEIDSEKFKIWEKEDETFYEFYFMPSKEMMKEIIETKITDPTASSSGYSNGNQNARMEKIKKLADKYGGSFDAIIKIIDSEGSVILYKHVTINPDVKITSKTVSEDPEDIDISLEIDYDKMYDYMEYISKDVQGTKSMNADWDKNSNEGNVGHTFGILSKGFGMWINGIKIKPVTEVPGLIFNLKLITEAFSD